MHKCAPSKVNRQMTSAHIYDENKNITCLTWWKLHVSYRGRHGPHPLVNHCDKGGTDTMNWQCHSSSAMKIILSRMVVDVAGTHWSIFVIKTNFTGMMTSSWSALRKWNNHEFHDEKISSCIDADVTHVHCSIVLTEKHHDSDDVTTVGMTKNKCHREEIHVIF
jgi:hypothetical protein